MIQFQKRLQNEQLLESIIICHIFCFFLCLFYATEVVLYYRGTNNSKPTEQHLAESDRAFFVNLVLKLIDRGQYSKNEHLSETVAAATSVLSYVEPSLVLPFVASRFRMALETVSSTA